MSMAPANSASIAEGPALKLFHSIFTCGPMAFSNHPLLLPTIAWGCVIFGNAPTRITLCPAASRQELSSANASKQILPDLVMSLPCGRHRHWQHILLCLLALAGTRTGVAGRPGRHEV